MLVRNPTKKRRLSEDELNRMLDETAASPQSPKDEIMAKLLKNESDSQLSVEVVEATQHHKSLNDSHRE